MIDEQAGKAFESGVMDTQRADELLEEYGGYHGNKLAGNYGPYGTATMDEFLGLLKDVARIEAKDAMLTGCTESLTRALERVAKFEEFVAAYDEWMLYPSVGDDRGLGALFSVVLETRRALSND